MVSFLSFRFVEIKLSDCPRNMQRMRLLHGCVPFAFLPDSEFKKSRKCVKCVVASLVIDEMFMFSSNFDGYDVVVCF